MYADDVDDGTRWSPTWVAGVGLMLLLTAMAPVVQAQPRSSGYPCVSTSDDGVSIGECGGSTSSSTADGVLAGGYPTASGSAAFSSTNATAVGPDIQTAWTFNERKVDAAVTAFHLERGRDPTLPRTMEHVATVGPDAEAYLDQGAATSGDVWYVVHAELEDGSIESSQPFRVDGVQTD